MNPMRMYFEIHPKRPFFFQNGAFFVCGSVQMILVPIWGGGRPAPCL